MAASKTLRILWVVVTMVIIVGLATLVVVLGHRVLSLSTMVDQMAREEVPLCDCRPCRVEPMTEAERARGVDTVSSLIAEIDTTREEQARLREAVQRAVRIHDNAR
jgi:heme/copper-type cytochrome/quinol oxidase subunit 2